MVRTSGELFLPPEVTVVQVALPRGADLEVKQAPVRELGYAAGNYLSRLLWKGGEDEFATVMDENGVFHILQNDGQIPELPGGARPKVALLVPPSQTNSNIKQLHACTGPEKTAGTIMLTDLWMRRITARTVGKGAIYLHGVIADRLRAHTQEGDIVVESGGNPFKPGIDLSGRAWRLLTHRGNIIYRTPPFGAVAVSSIFGQVPETPGSPD